MKFEEFLKIIGDAPVIASEILCAGVPDPSAIKVQLSRWEKAGKIIQLKRGVYILPEIYRKVKLFELSVAGFLKRPSYVSLQKAMEYHGLIPEAVFVYTSVTTKRPGRFVTDIGTFDFRHIKPALFWGYESMTLDNQTAFMASPEKALLDYFYLHGRNISEGYLEEMRLQNTGKINCAKLQEYAQRFASPGMLKTAETLARYCEQAQSQEKVL